jgi:glucose-1-phosphate thymidylyltransferase
VVLEEIMKTLGIILAAGRSTRLYPSTLVTTKQMLPIYDKPLIFYPLSLLMLGGIQDIVIISNPSELPAFRDLIQKSHLDCAFNATYLTQSKPNGIPEAFNIVKNDLYYKLEEYDNVVLILGDNVFHGAGLTGLVEKVFKMSVNYATIFGHKVNDLHRFGVATLSSEGRILSITEKPDKIDQPKHSYAITGLYAFPRDVFDHATELKQSKRGETEIVDLINIYKERHELFMDILPRGVSWFDTGTPDAMLDAAHYVKTIQSNQGLLVGSPHEVAYLNGWLDQEQLGLYVNNIDTKSDYAKKLRNYLED